VDFICRTVLNQGYVFESLVTQVSDEISIEDFTNVFFPNGYGSTEDSFEPLELTGGFHDVLITAPTSYPVICFFKSIET
jgi:hypothetical protein